MPSAINYTTTAKVAMALAMQTPETLSQGGNTGDTILTLSINTPQDWQVGSTLIIEPANSEIAEEVTITGAVNNNIVPVSPLKNSHSAGAPVLNATLLIPYIPAASRWIDTQTRNYEGLGYEEITEEKEAYINNMGYIVVPLSKPVVKLLDVKSMTFQSSLMLPADELNLSYARIKNKYFLEVAQPSSYSNRSGIATVTYSGGFNPVPDDIALASTVMAARFYKERDSGYSDAIGNSDTGIITYKKACPSDVKLTIQKYMRVTE